MRLSLSQFSILHSPLARFYQSIKDPLCPDIVVSQFLRMPLNSDGEGVPLHFHRFYDIVWGASGNGQPWCHILDPLMI